MVETQVVPQGVAGREIWLGVDLQSKGRSKHHRLDAKWRVAEGGGKRR